MASFIEIPVAKLAPEVLDALLQEFASRDGTDYGEVETAISKRVEQLRGHLHSKEMLLIYEAESEHWDLVSSARAAEFLED